MYGSIYAIDVMTRYMLQLGLHIKPIFMTIISCYSTLLDNRFYTQVSSKLPNSYVYIYTHLFIQIQALALYRLSQYPPTQPCTLSHVIHIYKQITRRMH